MKSACIYLFRESELDALVSNIAPVCIGDSEISTDVKNCCLNPIQDSAFSVVYFSEDNGSAMPQNQIGSGGSDFDNEDWSTTRLTDWSGTHGHTLTINSTGGAETRPKNVYVNYIIKCVK